MFKHRMNLHLFDVNPNTQTTLSADLSDEMKIFYSKYLLENAQANLIHDQFGQKHPIPQHGGKTIEFRKYDPLPKALTKLVEGVTPDGRSLKVTNLSATIDQYGDYITLSDVLLLTAIDNNLVEANELLGQQAGLTLDTVTREVINGGSQVIFAGNKLSRAGLNGGDYISVDDFFNAQRILKRNNAKDFGGAFVGIIHPDITYDVMRNPEWIDTSLYAGSTQLFNGEIGKIASTRFVETSEAKIWAAGVDLVAAGGAVLEDDVYSVLVLAKNAYGVTEIEGGGLEFIVNQLGSGGSADPLKQRATAGWKSMKVAERLIEPYMVRIECNSTKGNSYVEFPTIGTNLNDQVTLAYAVGGAVTPGTTNKLTIAATVSDGGTLTYQWYVNSSNAYNGASLISGETADDLIADVDANGDFYYFCAVKNTIGVTSKITKSKIKKVTVTGNV